MQIRFHVESTDRETYGCERMNVAEKIEIPLSKTKIFLHLFGSIIFVALFIFIIVELQPSFFIEVVGYCGVVFFGFGCLVLIRKLFDHRPGLMIDQNGITDNTNYTSVGRIEWKDIVELDTYQVESTKVIIIYIENPEEYIKRAKNSLAAKTMRMSQSMTGSPLSINSGALKISHDALERLLWEELEKRKYNSNDQ